MQPSDDAFRLKFLLSFFGFKFKFIASLLFIKSKFEPVSQQTHKSK